MWSRNISSQLCSGDSKIAVSNIYGGGNTAALIVVVMEVRFLDVDPGSRANSRFQDGSVSAQTEWPWLPLWES